MEGFSEFGFAGLVTASLLGGISFMVRWFISYMEKVTEAHHIERGEWRDQFTILSAEHRSERNEWRSEIIRHATLTEDKLDEVIMNIKSSNGRG